jgi:hypothetical protein
MSMSVTGMGNGARDKIFWVGIMVIKTLIRIFYDTNFAQKYKKDASNTAV